MKALLHAAIVIVVGFGCWIAGSLYPAPARLTAAINPQAVMERTRGSLQGIDWHALQSLVGKQQADSLGREAVRLAAKAGSIITVEHQIDASSVESDNFVPPPVPAPVPVSDAVSAIPAPAAPPAQASTQTALAPAPAPVAQAAPAPAAPGAFEASLDLCPRMTINNSPANDGSGHVAHYAPFVTVNGAAIAVDPTRSTCLSSGFGVRNGRLHKGVDYYNEAGGQIMAGGDGTILEMKYRDDYGNTILIDHGHGVYTRYCHMSSFQNGLLLGGKVVAGSPIGLMGNTAAYPIPLHLHYELLLGDYNNPKASFGLTPYSPFEYLRAG